jgi:Zn-dependent M28 family amino/carboxypeptidase
MQRMEPRHARVKDGSLTMQLTNGAPVSLALPAEAEKGTPRPSEIPVTISIRTSSTHRSLPTSNVVGRLEGRDAKLARTNVVLTAHLDHTGMVESGSGDRINNGAFDNAAGCAVLLEVARMLAQGQRPLRSVVVVFAGAEEQGLVGSDYFAHIPRSRARRSSRT